MAIAAGIKNLDFRQLLVLARVLLSKPRYIIPTFKATKKTLRVSNTNFGKEHHSNNRTNAFRHALWNYLIAENCLRAYNSKEKAINWSRRITDLHEHLSPNSELEKIMDLHNNLIGRLLFEEGLPEGTDIVSVLKNKMEKAVKVRQFAEIRSAGKDLVYLED